DDLREIATGRNLTGCHVAALQQAAWRVQGVRDDLRRRNAELRQLERNLELARCPRRSKEAVASDAAEHTTVSVVPHDDARAALRQRHGVRGAASLQSACTGMTRGVFVKRAPRAVRADERAPDAQCDVGAGDCYCVSKQQPLEPRREHHAMTLKT